MNEVRCASCGTVYSVEPSATQQSIECQICRTPLVLPGSTTAQSLANYPPQLGNSTVTATPIAAPIPPHLVPAPSRTPHPTNVSAGATPAAGPMPPHLMQNGAPTNQLPNTSDGGTDAPPVDSREEDVKKKYQPASTSTTAIAVFIVTAFVVLMLGMMVFVYLNKPEWFNYERTITSPDDPRPNATGPTESGEVKWSRRSVIRNDVKVGVQRVDVGPVLAKDEQNKVQKSDSSNFLHVYIRIENQGKREVKYRSWYGNTFNDESVKVVAN